MRCKTSAKEWKKWYFFESAHRQGWAPPPSWHTQYLSISSLINHSTKYFSSYISTARFFFVFLSSAFPFRISFQFETNKNSFWFIIWSHKLQQTQNKQTTMVRAMKKTIPSRCTSKLPFRCSIVNNYFEKETRLSWEFTRRLQVEEEDRKRWCWKNIVMSRTFFASFRLVWSWNWWISDSINFVFVLDFIRSFLILRTWAHLWVLFFFYLFACPAHKANEVSRFS